MGCRVGITTNPEDRELYWSVRHRNFRAWRILCKAHTRQAAQDMENRYAEQYKCKSLPGGDDRDAVLADTWYVYYFEHDGVR